MSLDRVLARWLIWLPLLDLGLVLVLAARLGVLRTLVWLLGTCMFGAFLVLGGGLRSPRGPRGEAVPPDRAWAEARLARLASGILWLWPGPLTDLAGAVLLVPALRRPLLAALWGRLSRGGFVSSFGYSPYDDEPGSEGPSSPVDPPAEGPIRDVEFEVLDRDRDPPRDD